MDFELRFTDKEITAWGGMALMKRMLDHMGFDAALVSAGGGCQASCRMKVVYQAAFLRVPASLV